MVKIINCRKSLISKLSINICSLPPVTWLSKMFAEFFSASLGLRDGVRSSVGQGLRGTVLLTAPMLGLSDKTVLSDVRSINKDHVFKWRV